MSQKRFRRILLANDDGIDAPGIQILEKVAEHFADEIWVVAPATDKSGVSNSISLREPVRVEARGARKFAVHGTPADCVAVAVRYLMKDSPPDVLLSGINSGSNIGFETVLSGTVGAAITGVLLGIPSIALSQDKRPEDQPEWHTAAEQCLPVLQTLFDAGLPAGCCLNVNFPNLPQGQVNGMRVTRQGIGKVKGVTVTPTADPHGEDYFWLRVEHGVTDLPENSEVSAVAAGFISVTPLTWERTSQQVWSELSAQLSQSGTV
ncbi:5'/3'-nucleotidase SurE [Pantoea rwandensis]|uniref:5'/3'-nucleotidase SurE n=1 Tax=Pantoea rwandensis TaxID=1076550 RepID=A0A1X1D3K3_9GAMM|nr:5'/3'-nucleotidase SurE [Pantoea rwandensis]ORM71226.1 5'/3'-nucleotidase SurE [Pantoea rwandensis]